MDEAPPFSIAVAGLSHHNARSTGIEAFRFPDEAAFLAKAAGRFRGVILLQTCNRVEVVVEGEAAALAEFLRKEGRAGFFTLEGTEAIRHLLELASGIDSMIVGEDQIIGQLKKALSDARDAGTAGAFLTLCINKAVHVGVGVRKRTEINRGAVSVGSAAVLLAEAQVGTLEGKHILVIGSGEMGLLVAQALAAKNLTAMYVANRTYGRAKALAGKIGGKAVRLSDLYRYITLSDVVISCTSAPHPVIHCRELTEAMRDRCWPVEGHPRPLVIIDIAQPRDVEEGADRIDGVRLGSSDNLGVVNEQTMASRKSEAVRAREYIEEELAVFLRRLNGKTADDMLSALHGWAETIRARERDRAIARLGCTDERTTGIIDDLTRVLANRLLADATVSVRASAEAGDPESADRLVRAITRGEAPASRADAVKNGKE